MFPTSPLKKRAAQKEKSHFTPQDEFLDLNPPITYRHFLSPPQGARDPLRVIALCDSDAFYAACEQVRLGIDPSRPLVVRQWDSLIAVNYPARVFGITRMNNWRDALKKCPELTVVHVATYKEGDNAPGYWDNPDTATHKVRPCSPWSSPNIVDTVITGALISREAFTFVSNCRHDLHRSLWTITVARAQRSSQYLKNACQTVKLVGCVAHYRACLSSFTEITSCVRKSLD